MTVQQALQFTLPGGSSYAGNWLHQPIHTQSPRYPFVLILSCVEKSQQLSMMFPRCECLIISAMLMGIEWPPPRIRTNVCSHVSDFPYHSHHIGFASFTILIWDHINTFTAEVSSLICVLFDSTLTLLYVGGIYLKWQERA